MKKVLYIRRAVHKGGYTLQLTFSDNKTIDVGFEDFLRHSQLPDTRKYRVPKRFRSFRLVDGDLMWGDFEMLFPIMDLYENRLTKHAR